MTRAAEARPRRAPDVWDDPAVSRPRAIRPVVLLLVGALIVAACGREPSASSSNEHDLEPLLIDPVPDGMELLATARGNGDDLVVPPPVPLDRPLDVYGRPGDDPPFAEPLFVLTTFAPPADGTAREYVDRLRTDGSPGTEAVDVGGVGGVAAVSTTEARLLDGLLQVVWPADDETLIVVASSRASADELSAFARHVSLGDGDRPVVDDGAGLERIGGLSTAGADHPGTMRFGLRTADNVQVVGVRPLLPEEQVAYLALMTEDPADAYRTEPSCCDPELLQPPRRVEVDGRSADLGTLTPNFRALVVRGDPGFVVLSGGNRLQPPHTDDELVALAENVRTATDEEADEIVAEFEEEAKEASYERAVDSLTSGYPGVEPVGTAQVRTRDVVFAAGTFAEPGTDPATAEPGICAQYFGEQQFGFGCIRRSQWEGTDVAAEGWYESVIVVGDERLDSVAIVPPDGPEIPGTVIHTDLGPGYPARIGFVYALVELQADPEIETRTGVPLVARDANGAELLRTSLDDFPSG